MEDQQEAVGKPLPQPRIKANRGALFTQAKWPRGHKRPSVGAGGTLPPRRKAQRSTRRYSCEGIGPPAFRARASGPDPGRRETEVSYGGLHGTGLPTRTGPHVRQEHFISVTFPGERTSAGVQQCPSSEINLGAVTLKGGGTNNSPRGTHVAHTRARTACPCAHTDQRGERGPLVSPTVPAPQPSQRFENVTLKL